MNALRVLSCVLILFVGVAGSAVAVDDPDWVPAEYDPSRVTPEMMEQTETIARALEGLTPEGWDRKSLIERYTPINLYDKINGRSELYMSYGVVGMTFVTYTDSSNPLRFIDIFLYDMGSVLGAFGIFSVERWAGGEPIEVGREAYRTNRDLFFFKGPYYVTVLAADDADVTKEVQLALARRIADVLEGDDEALWGLDVLPSERMVPGSVQYFAEDALSLEFMVDTFKANYEVGGDEVQVFVSRQDSKEKAASVTGEYAEYLKRYGSSVETVELEGKEVTLGEVGRGFFDAVFASGRYVAGTTAVGSRDHALEAVSFLMRALK